MTDRWETEMVSQTYRGYDLSVSVEYVRRRVRTRRLKTIGYIDGSRAYDGFDPIDDVLESLRREVDRRITGFTFG